MPKQKVSLKFIIKQSLKEFRSKGYNHTSMNDVALACGLKKGSLYHYFPKGKEELLIAVIEYMHSFFSKEAFIHAYNEQLGGRQRLQILADIGETQYFASEYGCLFGNLALEIAGIDKYKELFQKVHAFFDEWVAALTHIFKEKYDPETAHSIAKESLAEIEGAVMMMRIFNDKGFLKKAHQKIIDRYDNTTSSDIN